MLVDDLTFILIGITIGLLGIAFFLTPPGPGTYGKVRTFMPWTWEKREGIQNPNGFLPFN